MLTDPWLPIGFRVGQASLGRILEHGDGWQVYVATGEANRVLAAEPALTNLWVEASLLPKEALVPVAFGALRLSCVLSADEHRLFGLNSCPSPNSYTDALSFAVALAKTRRTFSTASLQGGVFVERYSVILPAGERAAGLDDKLLLGRYLTGGIPIRPDERERLASILSWLPEQRIDAICNAAGLLVKRTNHATTPTQQAKRAFDLPGRPTLAAFLQEHVIDIVEDPERYAALGVRFPGAVILHGPPGSGKTFAVKRLVEYLNWPCLEISSSSIGSPYIHQTGVKIGAVFSTAAEQAPAVVIIDEMEAFLRDRDASQHHHIEEVAEFLRCIQESSDKRILVLGMTNRLDDIDPAILRRGRFDHVVEVGPPSRTEVEELVRNLLASVPHTDDVNPSEIAGLLSQRPLSDVAFLFREAGRRTAREGRSILDSATIRSAAADLAARGESSRPERIGFRA